MATPAPYVSTEDRLSRVAAVFEDVAFLVMLVSAVVLVAAIVALTLAL